MDDPDADLDALARAIDAWPAEIRAEAAVQALRELPVGARWGVLAELFDDADLRTALADEHARAVVVARQVNHHAALLADVIERRSLDPRRIPRDDDLVLGLFRPVDVMAAVRRGSASTTCARRLVLRSTGDDDGRLMVLEDDFNPVRGLFVTPDYDESVWRAERVDPHAVVRLGAGASAGFEAIVYPGGRLDIETADGVRVGLLHAGYATVGGVDLFSGLS